MLVYEFTDSSNRKYLVKASNEIKARQELDRYTYRTKHINIRVVKVILKEI